MKFFNDRVSTVWIFLATVALLVFHLISIRWHIPSSVILFWTIVTLMIGTIIYQCIRIELSPAYAKVVLLEIAVTCFVFHMIYQIPYYGLRGLDAYKDMSSAKAIISSGYVMGDPQYINLTSHFPMIHILGAVLSLIASINLFSVAKWFPSLIDVALILSLYLLVRHIFDREKTALLSVLLFSCLQCHILLRSLFVRQTVALVLAVCCVYLYFSAKYSLHPTAKYGLSIVCLIGTVFAHHLTSFMLLIFLIIHFLITKMSEFPSLRRAYFGENITGEKVTTRFLLIAIVSVLAYWMYVVLSPIYSLIGFIRNLFNLGRWGVSTYVDITGTGTASILTNRGYILFYGFYFFHIIFGLILSYGFLHRAKKRRVESYSSTLFLFLCGMMGLVSLYLIAPAAFPHRYLEFGWLFGFAPLAVDILQGKYKQLRTVGVFLLFAFMLFNVYMIDPTAWDARAEGIPNAATEEDYAMADTFDFSIGKIFGPQNPVTAIYDTHNNLGTIVSLYDVDLTDFDWIIVQKKQITLEEKYYREPRTNTLAALERLASECPPNWNKIYESNDLSAFKPTQ